MPFTFSFFASKLQQKDSVAGRGRREEPDGGYGAVTPAKDSPVCRTIPQGEPAGLAQPAQRGAAGQIAGPVQVRAVAADRLEIIACHISFFFPFFLLFLFFAITTRRTIEKRIAQEKLAALEQKQQQQQQQHGRRRTADVGPSHSRDTEAV